MSSYLDPHGTQDSTLEQSTIHAHRLSVPLLYYKG